MAGAAAQLFRSVRSRKATMQFGARAFPRPQPRRQAQPEAAVLPPRLFFHGGLLRPEHLLPPMAAASRLFSSSSESQNKNTGVDACANKQDAVTSSNKMYSWEIKKQIVEKRDELLYLLLQANAERSSSISDNERCFEQQDQLRHLLQEFHAKTEGKEVPELDGFLKFLRTIGIVYCLTIPFLMLRGFP